MSVAELARAEVRALAAYAPDVADCAIDVSDNTNLWGAAPAALRALADVVPATITRYPALYAGALGPAILRYLRLEGSADVRVVTGCGSDDVLDAAMRAFGPAGSRLAFSAPTFSMIPTFARLNGIEPVAIPLTDAFGVDAERLVACDAAITYLCTPNNPTATPISRAAVEHVVANARGVVIIDQAYAEFAPDVFDGLVARHDRLLVTRTFSKAFGLAGLRVGYGVSQPELAGYLERARGPYKVNSLAERAVLASLEESDDALGWVRTHAALAIDMRERLSAGLRDLGLAPLPSAGNFVFVPTARARRIAARLRDRGILVRVFSGMPRDVAPLAAEDGLALRIGVGPATMMDALLQALTEVLR